MTPVAPPQSGAGRCVRGARTRRQATPRASSDARTPHSGFHGGGACGGAKRAGRSVALHAKQRRRRSRSRTDWVAAGNSCGREGGLHSHFLTAELPVMQPPKACRMTDKKIVSKRRNTHDTHNGVMFHYLTAYLLHPYRVIYK